MVNEMLHGVRLYFDRALGNMLLYRAERPQYSHAKERYMHDGETAAQVYGAEHLLRLFGMESFSFQFSLTG
jgi:mortality factor 4-like protein 1